MAVKPVITAPDPRLSGVSGECGVIDLGVIAIAQDLLDTMRSLPGCMSLSAPQIGVPLRMIVIAPVPDDASAQGDSGAYVVVNPTITAQDGTVASHERCTSAPGIVAEIERAARIFLRGVSIEAAEVGAEVTGAEAILIQHCVDHLDGKLITG